MLRILDRYIVGEIGPSFGLGLTVFSFVLLLNEILRYAQILIAQAASFGHVLGILANLLPSVLCVTIPMGVLLGILIALGRMSADSEITALRASGVSLYRLLIPILMAATIGWAASSYFIIYVLPDSNQAVRQLLFQVLTSKVKTDVRPRIFYDNLFPNLMFFVLDTPTGVDIWENVFLADLSNPNAPRITLAEQGRLLIDDEAQTVSFYLRNGESHQVNYSRPGRNYELQAFGETILPLQAESFFPNEGANVPRGPREMGFDQLYQGYEKTQLPVYLVEIHKKFSIPFACFVFGLLGLALGMRNRREGRSWGFLVSIAVIFIYYILIKIGEEMAIQQRLPPAVAMWGVNVILGLVGVALVVRNAREANVMKSSLGAWVKAAWEWARGLIASTTTLDSPPPPARTVLIIRIPRMVLRFPNTLDRYVAREFLRYFLLILAALVTVYVLGVLLDILEPVFENNIKGKLVFQYIGLSLPQILFHMLPLAALMATLVNFAILTKTSEMTAVKAGGVSLYRISLPIILVGGIVSIVCFSIQDYILPYSNRRAAELDDEIRKLPAQTRNLLNRRWMLSTENQIYHYTFYDADRRTFNGLAVYHFDESDFSLTERLYARQATWDPASGAWIFRDGWRRNFKEEAHIERFDEIAFRDMELPTYFVKEERQSDQMTYIELSNYIQDLAQSGFDVVRYRVELYAKISFPLAAMIIVIIGIPFSFTPGKKGALYGIGIAITIGLTYYVTTRIFVFMGASGMLPPLLAAWAPNGLFGMAALYGLFNVKT